MPDTPAEQQIGGQPQFKILGDGPGGGLTREQALQYLAQTLRPARVPLNRTMTTEEVAQDA